MAATIERGTFAGVPFAAVGAGRPLVVLPGLSPMTGVDSDRLVTGSLTPVRSLAGQRRLLVLNRWPGLPRDLTMAALARGHADAIREGFAGEPVDVLGVSTGGSIAQQLAARVAELLRTGATRPPAGRQERAWCRAR